MGEVPQGCETQRARARLNCSDNYDKPCFSFQNYGAPDAAKELIKHVDVQENVTGVAAQKSYTFTVKAKDGWKGKLTLAFPTVYREPER